MTLSTGPPEPTRPGGGDYRIDELARAAGSTVRNVRAYQDRGLLPPPRRAGRVGWYSAAHLARLRLIGALLERGYTLSNIAELVAAYERGQDVGALLGLEAVLGSWADRPTQAVTTSELLEMFGPTAVEHLDEAVDVGMLLPAGDDRYLVLNPPAVEVGALLAGAGVPLPAVLAAARRLRTTIGDVASEFAGLVEDHVFEPLGEPLPPHEIGRLARLVEALRPLAVQVVVGELGRAMEQEIGRRFGEHLERFAKQLAPGGGASDDEAEG